MMSYVVSPVCQVCDVGPVLDMMSVMLENISGTVSVARFTISAVYRTAQIIASVPNLTYQNKVSQTLQFILLTFNIDIILRE